MPTKPSKNVSELIKRLQGDKDLEKDKERKEMFMSYANMFEADLNDNLVLTSVELDNKYGTMNPSSWLKFLRHTIVKRYVDSFLNELAEKRAQVLLSKEAGKPRDALAMQKVADERNKKDDNANIVVMFMPQKVHVRE